MAHYVVLQKIVLPVVILINGNTTKVTITRGTTTSSYHTHSQVFYTPLPIFSELLAGTTKCSKLVSVLPANTTHFPKAMPVSV